ncbi:MAG TPA: hypothetical protein VFL97_07455 [Nitrococcus sp.]|nr:hypothetical protein [Nitrococcus sp.]
MNRSSPLYTIRILVAAIVMGLCQNAGAVTVLLDAAWVRAGFGSVGDRCLDDVLLDLKPGDRFALIIPTLGRSATLSPLVGFTTHRRPSVHTAELIATRRLLNRILATADPSHWPSLAQILAQLAASAYPANPQDNRYVIIGALTATDPPTVDLALQQLLHGRRVTIVDLAPSGSKLYDTRLKAWRNFFAATGTVQPDILPLSALSTSKPRTSVCSGHRLQILDH